MEKLLYVGLGGALGAILRYAISMLPHKMEFPVLTLMTNILGAIVIGIVVGLFEKQQISDSLNLFLKTGVCGGFTTFSTFSLEALTLIEKGMILQSGCYMVLSVLGCVLGVMIGKVIGQYI